MAGIVNRTSTRLGLHRLVVGRVTQVDLQLGLIRNGLGLAIVQHPLAASTSGLAVAELTDPAIHWRVHLTCRAPGPVTLAALALRDHLTPPGRQHATR